ncbi:MAG: hypothetical protein LBT39_01400 [Treponema sp.]|nr:hypothetical protein [Treponema sp.]
MAPGGRQRLEPPGSDPGPLPGRKALIRSMDAQWDAALGIAGALAERGR